MASWATLFVDALTPMTPLLVASVGEIINEKAGVVNIGIEGIMLLSAFAATLATFLSGSPLIGLAAGIGCGVAVGALHGFISVYLNGDQIISGIGINMFAYGLCVMGLVLTWHSYGASPSVPTLPSFKVGESSVSVLTIPSILIAVGAWYLITRTRAGLRIRACGEDPRSAEAMGINVHRVRFLSTLLGAALMGYAGAFLVIGWIGQFTKDITSGMGFIALANVAFSNWNPLLAILGAYIFGFFNAVPYVLQMAMGFARYAYLVKTIPYLATVAVLAIVARKARMAMPRALGKPYIKE
ncbi:MAG: ABC transporter permease [Crenarchaeota archaeon]|nr:ABC transporter permease [Thermoproteota archaeon]